MSRAELLAFQARIAKELTSTRYLTDPHTTPAPSPDLDGVNPERLALILPGTDTAIAPTHWSFGQLASLVGAPAAWEGPLQTQLA